MTALTLTLGVDGPKHGNTLAPIPKELWCIHTVLVRNWDRDRDRYYAEPFTLHPDQEEWVVWF